MTENRGSSGISAHYDDQSDILTFAFAETSQVIVAEEAADEVWMHYDPHTQRVISVVCRTFPPRLG
jgi:hypothetical protein